MGNPQDDPFLNPQPMNPGDFVAQASGAKFYFRGTRESLESRLRVIREPLERHPGAARESSVFYSVYTERQSGKCFMYLTKF